MEGTLEHLKEALRSWGEPLFLVNDRHECTFANLAFYQLLGLSASTPLEKHWPYSASLGPHDEELVTELVGANSGMIVVKRAVTACNDGFKLCRILGATSKDDSLINFHTQRLETLGMIAGGVAHDFNNILTGVLGHITYLKTILPASGPHVESLAAIEDGARRGSNITQQILDFSRLEVSDKAGPVNLTALVAKTCSLLRGAISPRYEMRWDLPGGELLALLEESRMAQVLINLAINSRDAIEPGGFIRISLEVETDMHALRDAFAGAEPHAMRYAKLVVEDNGHGIPESVRARIFEPYFSTKQGKGTGLGLATVRSIVRLFGGAIRLFSKEGEGTKVEVFLPLLDEMLVEKRVEAAAPQPKQRLMGGSERILIVDDEHPVRNVLSVSLQHLGYVVAAVPSGPEAISLFVKDPGAFDLVLLDMLMPQMSGKEVFCELKKLNPDVKVLAISGFTSEESIRYILDHGGQGFIQKPFTIEDLSEKVRACFA